MVFLNLDPSRSRLILLQSVARGGGGVGAFAETGNSSRGVHHNSKRKPATKNHAAILQENPSTRITTPYRTTVRANTKLSRLPPCHFASAAGSCGERCNVSAAGCSTLMRNPVATPTSQTASTASTVGTNVNSDFAVIGMVEIAKSNTAGIARKTKWMIRTLRSGREA
jgi:hypothetical protein